MHLTCCKTKHRNDIVLMQCVTTEPLRDTLQRYISQNVHNCTNVKKELICSSNLIEDYINKNCNTLTGMTVYFRLTSKHKKFSLKMIGMLSFFYVNHLITSFQHPFYFTFPM